MTVRSIRHRLNESNNIWPGFVDVLATLLIVIIFVLMVFTVSQIYLSDAISGRDKALEDLKKQINELSKILVIESKEKQIALEDLSKTETELEKEQSLTLNLESKVAENQKTISSQQLDISVLGKQIDELLGELKIVAKALEIYEELVREDYAPAKLRLAQVFFNGLSNSFSDAEGSGGYTIEKDYSRAKSLLEELITQGGPNHSALLATILECEAGPYERDYDAIINWKKVAGTNVKTGNALFYADELRTGSFTPQDLNRAEEIYEYYAEYGA